MYRLHVQLTPQIHEGSMKYYWHIDLHDGDTQITVKNGWAKNFNQAYLDSSKQVHQLKLV